MSSVRLIAETAFHLHEEKILSHEDLVSLLQQLVNSVSIENGHADKLGLPFPKNETTREGA